MRATPPLSRRARFDPSRCLHSTPAACIAPHILLNFAGLRMAHPANDSHSSCQTLVEGLSSTGRPRSILVTKKGRRSLRRFLFWLCWLGALRLLCKPKVALAILRRSAVSPRFCLVCERRYPVTELRISPGERFSPQRRSTTRFGVMGFGQQETHDDERRHSHVQIWLKRPSCRGAIFSGLDRT
jgi:hypothetical protein